MQMPGRTFTANGSFYRYGLNGQERSSELNSDLYNAQYWEYDSRIGRRWNLDPVDQINISNYAVDRNNPITLNDPLGNSVDDPRDYTVKKGDNLSKIAKRVGVKVDDLVKMNNIKDKNSLQIGQVLKVNPEVDFKDGPYAGKYYSNPNKPEGTEVHIDKVLAVGSQFPYGLGEENEIVASGKALNSIREWDKVQTLVDQGAAELLKDGKLTPGETFLGRYQAPTLLQYTKNYFQGKEKKYWTPIHVIGSFNFSMRVNADGYTTTITVYDSKTISSLSDNKLGQGSNKPNTSGNGRTPFSTQYIRFIWDVYIAK